MSPEIFISRDGQQYGPYSIHDLEAHIADGSISPDDLAWIGGDQSEWKPLRELADIEVSDGPTVEASDSPASNGVSGKTAETKVKPSAANRVWRTIYRGVIVLAILFAGLCAVAVFISDEEPEHDSPSQTPQPTPRQSHVANDQEVEAIETPSANQLETNGQAVSSPWDYRNAIRMYLDEDPAVESYVLGRYAGVHTHVGKGFPNKSITAPREGSFIWWRITIPDDPSGTVSVQRGYPLEDGWQEPELHSVELGSEKFSDTGERYLKLQVGPVPLMLVEDGTVAYPRYENGRFIYAPFERDDASPFSE